MLFDINRKKTDKPKTERLERLKMAMATDEMSCAGRLGGVIKSDFYTMLTNYMDVSPESVVIEIESLASGKYAVRLRAEADRVYNLGIPPVN